MMAQSTSSSTWPAPPVLNSADVSETCLKCRLINRRKPMICCDCCHHWAHPSCVKLTKRQADAVPIWHCSPCSGRLPESQTAADAVHSDLSDHVAEKLAQASPHVFKINSSRQLDFKNRSCSEQLHCAFLVVSDGLLLLYPEGTHSFQNMANHGNSRHTSTNCQQSTR